ncbi:hypothetical protein PENSPDRAFT_204027 [Peniophora sp. CONT]|nr:hypothetical protein PENSPDRAFT_204027 [Peniophora sp. CONT]
MSLVGWILLGALFLGVVPLNMFVIAAIAVCFRDMVNRDTVIPAFFSLVEIARPVVYITLVDFVVFIVYATVTFFKTSIYIIARLVDPVLVLPAKLVGLTIPVVVTDLWWWMKLTVVLSLVDLRLPTSVVTIVAFIALARQASYEGFFTWVLLIVGIVTTASAIVTVYTLFMARALGFATTLFIFGASFATKPEVILVLFFIAVIATRGHRISIRRSLRTPAKLIALILLHFALVNFPLPFRHIALIECVVSARLFASRRCIARARFIADSLASGGLRLFIAGAMLASDWDFLSGPRITLLTATQGNKVIKQRVFQGRYVLPSEVADLQINDPEVLLAKLNDILNTKYDLTDSPAMNTVMLYCINRGYDLGMSYGILRSWWSSEFPYTMSIRLEIMEHEDRKRRERAVVGALVGDCHIPPRRVWDLYSNRILPFWAVNIPWESPAAGFVTRSQNIMAVSHAWMSPEDRTGVITRINGNKWPVPIPKDICLDDIRIELLNSGAKYGRQYAWLDVLCLRQEGGDPEEQSLLAKEWQIDVPTIGAIYQHCPSTVLYLNGLGRPFEKNDLDSARHWCNRAWTMQEWCSGLDRSWYSRSDVSLVGVAEHSPRFDLSRLSSHDDDEDDFTKQLSMRMSVSDAYASRSSIIMAAAMMSGRQAERELDKLAGLAYFACGDTQPVFDATEDVDDVWLLFIDCMTPRSRGQLFFLFPVRGDGKYKWIPSWNQVLGGAKDLVANSPSVVHQAPDRMDISHCPTLPKVLHRRVIPGEDARLPILEDYEHKGHYSCMVVCLPSCYVKEVDNHPPGAVTENTDRREERRFAITFQASGQTDIERTFSLIARHPHDIPSAGTYCLLSNWIAPSLDPTYRKLEDVMYRYWVVGLFDEKERFHKISVLEAEDSYDRTGMSSIYATLYQALHLRSGDNDETSNWIRRVELA